MKKKAVSKSTYWEKLKDPRWQKKRLEVLDRSNFACELCGDKESTLHVHHKAYKKGAEPWEYDSFDELQCLCENCHANEHDIDRKLEEALYEFKTMSTDSGYYKMHLLGFLNAISFGYGPWKENLEILSYEHAEGFSMFLGVDEEKVKAIVNMANTNNRTLNFHAYSWKLSDDKNEHRSEYFKGLANDNPNGLIDYINSEYSDFKYWPDEFKGEICSILREKHGLEFVENKGNAE